MAEVPGLAEALATEAPSVDFSEGFTSGALTASRDVPAFIGDFFGGGGTFPISTQGLSRTVDAFGPTVDKDGNPVMGNPNEYTGLVIREFEGTVAGPIGIAPGRIVMDLPAAGGLGLPAVTVYSVDDRSVIEFNNASGVVYLDRPGIDQFAVAPITDPSYLDALTAELRNQNLINATDVAFVTGGTAILTKAGDTDTTDGDPDSPDIWLTAANPTNSNGIPNNVSSNTANYSPDEFIFTPELIALPIQTIRIPLGAVAGRVKLAENSTPVPRDRLFFNYSLFHNAALTAEGITVNRFTPGFEKTFFSGKSSLEVRAPFATTLDSGILTDGQSITGGGLTNTSAVEMGNVTATFKFLVAQTPSWVVSTGLGLAFPTADDITLTRAQDGIKVLALKNHAVHLMPYIGGLYAPDQRFFCQAIIQLDTPANNNPLQINEDPNGLFLGERTSALRTVGQFTDATFMYFDVSTGYWLLRNPAPSARVSGISGIFEIHYNRTLNQFDQINHTIVDPSNGLMIANLQVGQHGRFEQLNLAIGATIEFLHDTTLTLGYVTPVTTRRLFDGELRVNFNHRFGRSSYYDRRPASFTRPQIRAGGL